MPLLKRKPKRRKLKRRADKPKHEFNPAMVFAVAEAKAEDLELDLDAARYKARSGQGGDRRT